MRLMLFFNPETESLSNRRAVENIQLQYSLLLQRYLRWDQYPNFSDFLYIFISIFTRSLVGEQEGSKKFLEAMMVISYTQVMAAVIMAMGE